MSFPAKEVIKNRKSVRSFDGKPLSEEDKAALWQYLKGLTAPFGVKVEFRLLDAGENGLSSPVIIGARTYFAAKAERTGHFELGLGYSFEKACLYAASRGMGTVMLAASLNREAFEKALDVKENEVMPVASPVGYPAAKRSIRESLMRKGLKADDRVPWRGLQDEFGVIDPGELSPGMEAKSGVTMVSLHIDTTLQFGSPEEEQAYIDSMVQQLIAETLGERAMTDTNVFVGTVSSVDSLVPQDLYSQLSRHRSFDQNRAADGSAEYIIRADMENRTLLCFFCETPEDANLLVRWLNERDTE